MAREPKRAQQVARQIESEILEQRLTRGTRLGSEPELTERYGVSRAVLREAIRIVERHQLAETRRGTGGGLFVAEPVEQASSQVLCAYLEAIGLSLDELFEARRLLETELVRHAAIRGGKKGARMLEALLQAEPEPVSDEAAVSLFDRCHAAIGRLSGSPGLALFVRTLQQLEQRVALGLHFERREARERYLATWNDLLATADAIGAHHVERAQLLVRARLDDHHKDWSTRRRRRRFREPVGARKRGEVLARVLLDDIRRAERRPGDRLGSEAELVARHAVSRAVLREAIRLLEQHGIVEMRRGIGGGLIVSEPDSDAVVATASAYLAHLGLTVEPIKEARLLLEPFSAAMAAERASSLDLDLLATSLDARSGLRGGRGARALREMHEQIADLSGNRAIALFTRVMIVAAWGFDDTAVRALPSDALESLLESDGRIVAAIRQRDSKRARRLMADHIQVTLEWWSVLHPR